MKRERNPRRPKPEVEVKKAGKGWGVYVDGIYYDWFEFKNDALRQKWSLEREIRRDPSEFTREAFVKMRARGRKRNPEVIDPELTEDIMDSMARTLFVEAWANYIEEEHPEQTRGWAGQDIMDIAPETSPWAHKIAKDLYLKIEKLNGLHSILKEVERLDADEDLFGHYLVMESLGHGVAWSDDYDPHHLELPYIETWWDGRRLYVSGL